MWAFFWIRNYFAPIKKQFMILLLKKLSRNKLGTMELSLNKLAIILFNITFYLQHLIFNKPHSIIHDRSPLIIFCPPNIIFKTPTKSNADFVKTVE